MQPGAWGLLLTRASGVGVSEPSSLCSKLTQLRPSFLWDSERRQVDGSGRSGGRSCSVAQSCLTLCDPMDCSTLSSPVLLHYLPEFAQRWKPVSQKLVPFFFFFNVSLIFFKDYFDADHFKSLNFIELVTVLLLFNFCLFVCFGHKAWES